MPIYEYKCESCEKVLEAFQKITDGPLTECRECGGQLRKLISSSAFVLKGTGWYVTDFAGKDKKEETGTTTAATETKSEKTSGSGDSSPSSSSTSTTTSGTTEKKATEAPAA